MTIENERLVDYLGLELELCYRSHDGRFFWVVVDKIRRREQIAREMLRLFNRFTRIGKSFDRVNAQPPIGLVGGIVSDAPASDSRAPYSRCVAIRMRVRDMTCGCHVRLGADSKAIFAAPRFKSEALLDPTLDLGLSDPILQVLTLDAQTETGATRARGNGSASGRSGKTIPAGETARIRGKRPSAVNGNSEAAAAITLDVQSANSLQQTSQSTPDHSPSTPATPSVIGTPSDASSSSVTSIKPK